MIEVKFYENNNISDQNIKFVVIMSEYKNKWIMVRHEKRNTWEIPGGHIEHLEKVEDAAKRELYEETGAIDFRLSPICIYSVTKDKEETFGQLYYANINKLDKLPESEIAEIKLFDNMPEEVTYPLIQPFLYDKVQEYLIEIRE